MNNCDDEIKDTIDFLQSSLLIANSFLVRFPTIIIINCKFISGKIQDLKKHVPTEAEAGVARSYGGQH